MESLLCNEVWLIIPNVQENVENSLTFSTKEDCEQAFDIFRRKEAMFLPQVGYSKLVKNHHLIREARFKAVSWIVKTQRRMDLSLETVFMAVNYLDRFISMNQQCQGWKCWTFELLSLACLSVASKFTETTPRFLYEFQIDDSKNCFDPTLIHRMELKLLKMLDWRMDSTTPFSYIDLIIQSIDAFDKTSIQDLSKRVIELLLHALADPKFVEFHQCVMAMSAIRCVLEDLSPSTNNASVSVSHVDYIIRTEHKDDLMICQRNMEKLLVQDSDIIGCRNYLHSPPSPVTVLFFDIPSDRSPKAKAKFVDLVSTGKRKREKVGELN